MPAVPIIKLTAYTMIVIYVIMTSQPNVRRLKNRTHVSETVTLDTGVNL